MARLKKLFLFVSAPTMMPYSMPYMVIYMAINFKYLELHGFYVNLHGNLRQDLVPRRYRIQVHEHDEDAISTRGAVMTIPYLL